MKHPAGRILVFAKAPVPGACKSRLAAGIGARRAAQAYRHMVAATLCQAEGVAPVSLLCSPDTRDLFFSRLRMRRDLALHRQPAGNLGQRMHAALAFALRRCDYAVLVGTDCPWLTRDYLDEALARLAAGNDAVFAPTEDGGYALVGLTRAEPRVFRGLAWSGPRVMAGTRHRLRRLGLRWSELVTLADVDARADWLRARRAGVIP